MNRKQNVEGGGQTPEFLRVGGVRQTSPRTRTEEKVSGVRRQSVSVVPRPPVAVPRPPKRSTASLRVEQKEGGGGVLSSVYGVPLTPPHPVSPPTPVWPVVPEWAGQGGGCGGWGGSVGGGVCVVEEEEVGAAGLQGSAV